MPITLDPVTALVCIDLQKGIVAMPVVHPAKDVVTNAVSLTRAFRAARLPVVLVHVGWSADFGDAPKNRAQTAPPAGGLPPNFSDYVDELEADASRDILIKKNQWGAFYGTGLDLQLRRRKVTNIVLCGISTSIGVESTARDAWERGYNITFVSDATTDTNQSAHDRAFEIIFPRLGEISTAADIVTLLSSRLSSSSS